MHTHTLAAPLLALLALASCATRHVATTTPIVLRDSTHTATSLRVVERIETLRVSLPAQTAAAVIIAPRCTTSHLQTTYAQAWASIDAQGVLHHRLANKTLPLPIAAPVREVRRDSLIYRYRDRPIAHHTATTYERTRLRWWHWLQIAGFWLLLATATAHRLRTHR